MASALLLAFGLTIAIDRLIGMWARSRAGLIFPPHSTYEYQTSEYRFTSQINSLGFRDREFAREKSAAQRIVVLGDSFTYGWGVPVERSWPKVLERSLREQGLSVEVANLGYPGAGPVDYADVAERAIPLLRPDLVLIAILQGSDLAQAVRREPVASSGKLLETFWSLYPNVRRLGAAGETAQQHVTSEQLRQLWKDQAAEILLGLGPEERERYGKLEPGVRDAFSQGRLNPWWVLTALRERDHFIQSFDLASPRVHTLIGALAAQFVRIRSAAEHQSARAVAVSIPYGIYISRRSFDSNARLGLELTESMLGSDSPDAAIRRAATSAGIPFVSVTATLRRKAETTDLYFPWDCHFNAEGHRSFGEALAPEVAQRIQARSAMDN